MQDRAGSERKQQLRGKCLPSYNLEVAKINRFKMRYRFVHRNTCIRKDKVVASRMKMMSHCHRYGSKKYKKLLQLPNRRPANCWRRQARLPRSGMSKMWGLRNYGVRTPVNKKQIAVGAKKPVIVWSQKKFQQLESGGGRKRKLVYFDYIVYQCNKW